MDSKDVQKPLPEKWVNIFDLIEQMGEINYSNYKIFNNCINFSQHWKLISIWDFLFCTYYYLYLGMWRKAFLISIIYLAGLFLLIGIDISIDFEIGVIYKIWGFAPSILAGIYSPFDYYRKQRMGDISWVPFPFS